MSSRSKSIETALVATLDILGVSDMMKAVEKEALPDLAQSLEEAFMEAKATIVRYIDAIDTTSRPDLKMARLLKIRVFSDTIVVSCDFNRLMQKIPLFSRLDCPEYQRMVLVFFLCVKSLAHSLFYAGYPSRGCITAGHIVITNNFVMGKPFVDSLENSKELNFAGVVLTDCAKILYDTTVGMEEQFAHIVPVEKHLIYNKHNQRKRYYCLNFLDSPNDKFLVTDMAFLFSEHGKKITEDVQEKMSNTKQLLESFLRSVRHNPFCK